jgi:hypothetical protein
MFIAFMSLHILLCDKVIPYFILHVEVIRSFNSDLNQKNLNLYKGEFKDNPANPANPTWVKGKGSTQTGLRVLSYPSLTWITRIAQLP